MLSLRIPPKKAREVSSGRLVRIDCGEDGRAGLVVYHYADDPAKRRHTATREEFFLCGYFIADFEDSTLA
jgi:hypothetical protein